MIKKTIKKWLRHYGKEIKPIDEYFEKLEPVKNDWLKSFNVKTIFDVGSSDGGYAKKIRQVFPNAMIYSFEAIPESYQKLLLNFKHDNKLKAFNVCLNNYNGTCEFNISEYSGSSSILKMNDMHKKAYPYTAKHKIAVVECKTLDTLVAEKSLVPEETILLKLDVQGAEWNILEGAKELIKKVKIVFMEVSFHTLYDNSILFTDIIIKMNSLGFKVKGIENVSQSLVDGTYLQCDAYFIKED